MKAGRPMIDSIPCISLKSPNIIPDRIRVSLPYSINGVPMGNNVGTLTSYLFRGNSVYDPDYTGAGHQPLGYDQLSALYEAYQVIGSSIVARFFSTLATNSLNQAQIGIFPSMDVTAPPLADQCQEQPYCKWKQAHLTTGTNTACSVFNKMTSARMAGKTIDLNSDEYYGALTNANPSVTWYWNVFAEQADQTGGDTSPGWYASIKLVYDVIFFRRKQQSVS